MPTGGFIPLHGNYRGYYTKRSSARDPRLDLLPPNIFAQKRVLDVGCNEGWVTCEIAQSPEVKEIIGVDIDDVLVRAAWKRRRSVWSQQQPHDYDVFSRSDNPDNETNGTARTGLKRKLIDSEGEKVDQDAKRHPSSSSYFPTAFEHMFGPLPIPPTISSESQTAQKHFPHNITFRTADWLKDGIVEDSDGYDVVIAFSVTKWIHLNNRDEGLGAFFHRVYDVLGPGGIFILEPQEWDSYAKAKRLDAKLKENAKDLQLRPEDYPRLLQEMGFEGPENLGTTGKGGFRRPIDLYRKPYP